MRVGPRHRMRLFGRRLPTIPTAGRHEGPLMTGTNSSRTLPKPGAGQRGCHDERQLASRGPDSQSRPRTVA
jgi:hypothetical protein